MQDKVSEICNTKIISSREEECSEIDIISNDDPQFFQNVVVKKNLSAS